MERVETLNIELNKFNLFFIFSPVRQVSIPIEGVSLVVNGIDVVDDTGRPVVVKIVSEHG